MNDLRAARRCPTCGERYPGDFKVCPRDATALERVSEEDIDALVGAIVGDTFQITRVIGEGGMARVYEARHIRLPDRRFAVKVLNEELGRQPDVVARFRREAEATSGIAHPNVLDVYDVHETPAGTPYLVSELLEGQDFDLLLEKRGKIELAMAIRIVRQVCGALAAAHDRGVVHRDMKPANIFLIGDVATPIVKVIDFGISKTDTGVGAGLTRTGMIMGTPSYMAPEQARGSKVDHRADIYSVGATLYRALTGRTPFDGEDAAEVLGAVLTQEPPRPRSIAPEIPPALEVVLQRAMAKNPDERFQTMRELDAALEPFDVVAHATSMIPPPPSAMAGRAVAPSAPTVLRSGSIVDRERTVAIASRQARLARPSIAVGSLAVYLWNVALLLDAMAAGWQLARSQPPSGGEVTIMAAGLVLVSITPVVFWARFILREVWSNTARCIEVAQTTLGMLRAAVLAYGALALALRVLSLSAMAGALGVGAAAAELVLVLVAVGLEVITYTSARVGRGRGLAMAR